jgi:hypothetical protein
MYYKNYTYSLAHKMGSLSWLSWPSLAFIGLCLPLIAFICLCTSAFIGLWWPLLAFIDLLWYSVFHGQACGWLLWGNVWNIWQNTVKYDNFVNLDPSQTKVNNRDPLDFAIKNPPLKGGYFNEIGEIFSFILTAQNSKRKRFEFL